MRSAPPAWCCTPARPWASPTTSPWPAWATCCATRSGSRRAVRCCSKTRRGPATRWGRSFDELAELLELAGGHERLGLCLDSCHLLASGFDVRTSDGLTEVLDSCVSIVGENRLRCVHVNDSQTPLGSNRDRHAPLGEGELGARGCGAFLSEPRFEGLPAIFEGPGQEGKAPTGGDIKRARELRRSGLRARKRRSDGPAQGSSFEGRQEGRRRLSHGRLAVHGADLAVQHQAPGL